MYAGTLEAPLAKQRESSTTMANRLANIEAASGNEPNRGWTWVITYQLLPKVLLPASSAKR